MQGIMLDAVWQGYQPKTVQGWRRHGTPIWALKDVSAVVDAGEMVGIVGSNGSGKTTLLQTVSGVMRPMKGTVQVAGRVSSLVELSAGFHRELTGRENLLIGGVLLGFGRREIVRRLDEIVAFSGLDGAALASPLRTYSLGMTLRLGFSLVAHSEPAVLVVDEVLAVGDEMFQERCVQRVDVLREQGCAVMIATHDLDLVRERCDRALALHHGVVVADGDPVETVEAYLEMHGGVPPVAERGASMVGRRVRPVRWRKWL